MNFADVRPAATEAQKRDRARRLATFEIPILRVVGMALVALGVFINNRYLVHEWSLAQWSQLTTILAAYCMISWLAILALYDRVSFDISLFFLAIDVAMWTLAIYVSGAERSWLFFILFMRVADQVNTTFRRCLAFTIEGTICYAAMLLWVQAIDHHAVSMSTALSRLIFVFFGGFYIALTARGAEARRRHLGAAMRTSRALIERLEEQSRELVDARARAEEASAAKSEFLANMSHEMRTPLHGILGMLQLAAENEASPQRLRQLEMARLSAQSLLGAIDDILDFSKIEARKLDLEPIYFSLREMIAETTKGLGVTAAEKKLMLAVRVAPDVPDRLWGDPFRLRQVITNLIGNAIKFTPAGEVVMHVTGRQAILPVTKREGTGEIACPPIIFEIRDSGIGIDADKRELIFRPFAQADSSHTRRYGGTGLGLSIVAKLVEAMGGGIDFDSEPGRGSTFRFTVRMPSDALQPQAVEEWESALHGLRVVISEPHAASREAIAEMLRTHGIVPVDGPPFDCAIVAKDIDTGAPVVRIVSPLAHRSDLTAVTRPVAERELIDAVGAAVGVRQTTMQFSLPPQTTASRALDVLLADDHPVNQEFAAETLRRLGHNVTVASTGMEVLEVLRRRAFDLVLMDVQMPDLDGLEVTRRYRATEETRHTRIVALTAHSSREDRERCLAAGMDGFLAKPVDARALGAITCDVAAEPDEILGAVDNNLELLARVRTAFAAQTPPLLASMHDAIERCDGERLMRDAHKLKGAVSNFGLGVATLAASDLEQAGRKADFERAAALMPRLEEALAELEARLAALR